MSWDAVGALAELVGAIAVGATLLYLGAQIRQNTIAVRGSTYQNLTDAAVTFNDNMRRDPEALRVSHSVESQASVDAHTRRREP